MKAPLLVTGASGLLGRVVCRRAAPSRRVLAAAGAHPERCAAGETVPIDLADAEAAEERIVDLSPGAIVHAAAINPGGPEERMDAVNVGGTAAVARAAQRLGVHLVHVSTDVVHDGEAAPYADDAPPAPLSTYARTKAEAEDMVRSLHPEATIVRTSLIYGLEEMDRSTAGFAARIRRGETVSLFADQLRQPIWVETLAAALLELAAGSVHGFLNVAGAQVLSRDDFGRRMLRYWGVDLEGADVRSVRSADLGVRQPRDLRLDLSRARSVLATPLPGVDEVLGKASGPLLRGGSSPGSGSPGDRTPP